MASLEQRKNQIKEHLSMTTDVNCFQQTVTGLEGMTQRQQRLKDHVGRTGQRNLGARTPEVNFFRQSDSGPEMGMDRRQQRIKEHVRKTLG